MLVAKDSASSTETKIAAVLYALAGAIDYDDPDLLEEWFELARKQSDKMTTSSGCNSDINKEDARQTHPNGDSPIFSDPVELEKYMDKLDHEAIWQEVFLSSFRLFRDMDPTLSASEVRDLAIADANCVVETLREKEDTIK